jgi:hypothetical protein
MIEKQMQLLALCKTVPKVTSAIKEIVTKIDDLEYCSEQCSLDIQELINVVMTFTNDVGDFATTLLKK